MKTALRITIGLLLTSFLAGCVVTSVYPYYTPKDVVFDPALVGTWAASGSTNAAQDHWRFDKAGDRAYILTMQETDQRNEFDAHLFKLKGILFLDLCSRERADYSLPTHYLLKVSHIEPTLEWSVLDYDWLTKLVEKHPDAIRHLVVPKKLGESGNGDLALTADTAELQKFILKHMRTEGVFTNSQAMRRWQH